MKNWTHDNLNYLRKFFPIGARIKLNYMNDAYAVPSGTKGTIKFIDDAGTIHVAWDNGSTLGVIWGEDSFEVIQEVKDDKMS